VFLIPSKTRSSQSSGMKKEGFWRSRSGIQQRDCSLLPRFGIAFHLEGFMIVAKYLPEHSGLAQALLAAA